MHSSRADHRAGRRSLAALALAPALLLALAACGDSESLVPQEVANATAGPAGVGGSGSTATPSASDGPTSTGDGSGCSQGKSAPPADSEPVEVGDLDGDGARDQLWIARDGDKRVLGVHTASGATFSTKFSGGSTASSASSASAVANRLGDDSAIVLLNTGRSAALYAVVDCRIVPTENVAGAQYEFDLGFGSYGTGVACPMAKGELFLAGYKTEDIGRDGYKKIVRTKIDLSENGTVAANGTVADLGEHAEDTPSYQIAESVSCGDSGTAHEPES